MFIDYTFIGSPEEIVTKKHDFIAAVMENDIEKIYTTYLQTELTERDYVEGLSQAQI